MGHQRKTNRVPLDIYLNKYVSGVPYMVRAADIRTPFTTGGLIVIGSGGSAAGNAQFSGIMFGLGGAQQ